MITNPGLLQILLETVTCTKHSTRSYPITVHYISGNNQNRAAKSQLTSEVGQILLKVIENLLMFDREGALYSAGTTLICYPQNGHWAVLIRHNL